MPNGCRQVVWIWVAFLLVIFALLLSNEKGFLWPFVRCEPVDNLARFKTLSKPAGKLSKFCKRKIIGNPEL